MITIGVSQKNIRSIDDNTILSYRIEDKPFDDNNIPCIGKLYKAETVGDKYILTFDVEDSFKDVMPEHKGMWEYHVDEDGKLIRFIAVLGIKTYSLPACCKRERTLCKGAECNECGKEHKTMKEKTYKYMGRDIPVKDAELDEQVKAYALQNNVSYEQALLIVSREMKGE